MFGTNALQDAEAGVAGGAHRDALVVQVDQPVDVELRLVADQPHLGDAHRVPIERQADRRRVAQPVVEQPQVEPIDRRLDQQLVDVGELADDANVAAGDGGGVRRQLRIERADVRIERRVGDAERQLRVHRRRQRDAAGARDREARRRRLELQRQQRRR